jgi:hypothetical protein
MVGRSLPTAGEVTHELKNEQQQDGYTRFDGLLNVTKAGEQLPATMLHPANWNGTVVAWIDAAGKKALFMDGGELAAPIASLVRQGAAVAAVDVLYTGDFLEDGQPLTETRSVDNPREIAAYTLGYNHPLFAQRTHDVMSLISFLRHHDQQPQRICVVGIGPAAMWATAAFLQAGSAADKLAVMTDGFRFANVTSIRDPQLWPGAVKYGDVPGLLSLCAPRPLWIAGEGPKTPDLVTACYAAASAPGAVTMHDGSGDDALNHLVAWLQA